MSSSCAICFENFDNETVHVAIPCCEREETSLKFCYHCITILCSNGVGVCPRCNGPIEISHPNDATNGSHPEVIISERRVHCRMCNHIKPASAFNRLPATNIPGARPPPEIRRGIITAVCSVCEIGIHNPLRYECQQCHRIQRIVHPMYRYQENSPEEFGNTTWACHQRCGDYTRWRIIPQDIPRIPVDDIPENWGEESVQRRNFELIRNIRRNEMNGRRGGQEQDGGEGNGYFSSCTIQ